MASILRTVRSTERLAQITLVLARHGFGQLLSRLPLGPLAPARAAEDAGPPRTFAVRLREVLQELGPSFVKLGQVMSTRPDVLPADVVAELRKLQAAVPPMTDAELDEVLGACFGDTLDATFAAFQRAPLASASIGQVHLATLRRAPEAGGDVDVVVKLQRPGARDVVERDLDLLYLLARLIATHVPESRVYAPVALVTEFDRAITAELDYGLEADHAERFAREFAGDPTVRFPAIFREASGKRALVMERFVGKHLDDFVRDGDAGTGPRVARRALHVVAKMAFEHGFFHADPHPGNIIMLGTPAEPVVGLIDLGLVGRLNEELRDKAVDLMLAAVSGDPRAVADALLAMGRPRGKVDLPAFRAEVEVLAGKYLGRPLAEVELASLINDLVRGAVRFDIEMPAELMMIGKALMTIEGIGKQLDPSLDPWTELRPYFTQLVMERYSPQRLGRELLRGLRTVGRGAGALPGQLHDILEDLRAGRLTIAASDPARAMATERLGRRLFAAIVGAALLGAGTTLLAVDRHPTLATTALVLAALLLARQGGPTAVRPDADADADGGDRVAAAPRAPRRVVEHGDGVAWLRRGPLPPDHAVVTSLPDASEVPELGDGWAAWFVEVAALICRQLADDAVAVFYQTDVKRHGRWVDKGYLVQRGAEEAGSHLLWHKVVCRVPPGTITMGRPAYAHLLAVSRALRLDAGRSTADVLPDLGEMTWSRAMGVAACDAAARFVATQTACRVVVDPFCGLGTMLAVANAHGLHAVGVERVARRVRRARTLRLDPDAPAAAAPAGADADAP